MSPERQAYHFDQLHIDIARNATDDFNPFHDPARWHRVQHNPYGNTIVMGFQLEALVDYLIEKERLADNNLSAEQQEQFAFINYEFRFAGALRPGEGFGIDVRRTVRSSGDQPGIANRAVLQKSDGSVVLLANRSDSRRPRFLCDWSTAGLPPLGKMPDRSFIADHRLFMKRKFMNTSNGKNFVLGALVDQAYYFDELDDRVNFPPIFTASLLSCALLEMTWVEDYDFQRNPQVYVSHQISVDQRLQTGLRSNDRLDILVDGPHQAEVGKGLSGTKARADVYHCYGIVKDTEILFRALIRLVSLESILGAHTSFDISGTRRRRQ